MIYGFHTVSMQLVAIRYHCLTFSLSQNFTSLTPFPKDRVRTILVLRYWTILAGIGQYQYWVVLSCVQLHTQYRGMTTMLQVPLELGQQTSNRFHAQLMLLGIYSSFCICSQQMTTQFSCILTVIIICLVMLICCCLLNIT